MGFQTWHGPPAAGDRQVTLAGGGQEMEWGRHQWVAWQQHGSSRQAGGLLMRQEQ